MKLSEYQSLARRSDKTPLSSGTDEDPGLLIPFLGLAGEAGQLLAEFKKRLRDGAAHAQFVERVSEELGDILWYVSNLASKYELNLDEIAQRNLDKTQALYERSSLPLQFDKQNEIHERFPRLFIAQFCEIRRGERVEVRTLIDGTQVGAALTDNAYADDGYRFHDVLHMSFAAHLGWSPVLRSIMKLKRRSTPLIDEVEDGGRAAVIEEGIAAAAFNYARKHNFLEGVSDVDPSLLETMRGMCAHLEVAQQPPSAWRHAILEGFDAWRNLISHRGGSVTADLDQRTLLYSAPIATTTAAAAAGE